MNISIDSRDEVAAHLGRVQIDIKEIEELGRILLNEKHPGKIHNGRFSLITEGFGSSSKFRFDVFEGQGYNKLVKQYFIRVIHSETAATEDLGDEIKALMLLNDFPSSYKFVAQYEVNKKTNSPTKAGVFNFLDGRHHKAMYSLRKRLQSSGETNLAPLCKVLKEALITLATKFNGQTINDKIKLKPFDSPPDFVAFEAQPPSSTCSLQEGTNEYEVVQAYNIGTNTGLLLTFNNEKYFIQFPANSDNTPRILHLSSTRGWESFGEYLIKEKFISKISHFRNEAIKVDATLRCLGYCHNDLHLGNIFVSEDINSTDLVFIDFCDAGKDELVLSDFAFLSLSTCLDHASQLCDFIGEVFLFIQDGIEPSQNVLNMPAFQVLKAIREAQTETIDRLYAKALVNQDVLFTYFFVAHRYLQYVFLEERSESYKTVIRSWLDFFDPERAHQDKVEKLLIQYAEGLRSEWDAEKKDGLSFDPNKQRASRRLDCYVDPDLVWVDSPDDDDKSPGYRMSSEPRSQLFGAFERCLNEKKNLFVIDGGGAGKSILAFKFATLLSSEGSDSTPYLVFLWDKDIQIHTNDLRQLLLNDKRYKKVCQDGSLIDKAISQNNLVIILDGLDELPLETVKVVNKLFASKMPVRWVLTGRQYVFRAIDSNFTKPERMLYLRICPFSTKQQDDYFELAEPDENRGSWRSSLGNLKSEYREELLSLPQTLRSLLMLRQAARGRQIEIQSGSDLYLQLFEISLDVEINKYSYRGVPVKDKIIDLFESDAQAYRAIELLISSVAFEMAKEGYFRVIQRTGNATQDSVQKRIMKAVTERVKSEYGCQFVKFRWRWMKEILSRLLGNQWNIVSSKGTFTFAFRHRLILEFHCANFLVSHARDEDLSSIQRHNGNPAWEQVWRLAIEMPRYDASSQLLGQDRLFGFNERSYRMTQVTLFGRQPIAEGEKGSAFRRPTALMYEALEWMRENQKANNRDFFPRLVTELTSNLSKERQGRLSIDLIDNQQDECKVLFRQIKSLDNGLYVSKTPVTKKQFNAFDSIYGTDDLEYAPANDISWYDAYFFCVFLNGLNVANTSYSAGLLFTKQLMWLVNDAKHQFTSDNQCTIPSKIFCDFELQGTDLRLLGEDRNGLIGIFNSGFEWCTIDRDSYPWPNEYFVVPGLRPAEKRFRNVIFRVALIPEENCQSGNLLQWSDL